MLASKIQKLYHEAGHCLIAKHFGRQVDCNKIDLNNPSVKIDSISKEIFQNATSNVNAEIIDGLRIDIVVLMAGRVSEDNYSSKLRTDLDFCTLIYHDKSLSVDTKSDVSKILLRLDVLMKQEEIKACHTKISLCMELYIECIQLVTSDRIWCQIEDFVNDKKSEFGIE